MEILKLLGHPDIWSIPSAEVEPEVTLVEWDILEMPNGNRVFNGNIYLFDEGRVSSAIHKFDIKELVGVTESGRVYQLKGPPGTRGNALHVLNRWYRINDVKHGELISRGKEVWEQHQKAVENK